MKLRSFSSSKHRLGQYVNIKGMKSVFGHLWRNPGLALPNLKVKTVADIDFDGLHARGFTHVVFDKDNTLTLPYQSDVAGIVQDKFGIAKTLFGKDGVLLFSNSAGSPDDDGYKEARFLEQKLGVCVLRHTERKPGGGESLREQVGPLAKIAVVGDRLFTDVLFANLNGYYSILVEPLDARQDNVSVRTIRAMERLYQVVFSSMKKS